MRRTLAFGTAAFLSLAGVARDATAQAPAGFRGEFLATFAQLESKFTQLTSAIPQDKWDWKPNKDVRSFCEVFRHITVDNYMMGGTVGLKMGPDVTGPNAEKCPANKASAVTAMKESFTAFKTAVVAMKDADLETRYTLFGSSQTKRAWLVSTAEHAGEHLGQLIAYTRMNNIVPPWSK